MSDKAQFGPAVESSFPHTPYDYPGSEVPLVERYEQPRTGEAPRVLLFSQRYIGRPVWHGGQYEFEDVIAQIDAVRVLAPQRKPSTGLSGVHRSVVDKVRATLGLRRKPYAETIAVRDDYELFFAALHFPWQLVYLQQLKGWRRRCRKAVCFILEQWRPWVSDSTRYFQLLKDFDHVFVFARWSLPAMAAIAKRPCEYMAMGVDAELFCPYPARPRRTIDVYSLGRREPETHQALLELMKAERLTYIYDSFSFGSVPDVDHREHRSLVAHLIKRSRYFVTHKINDSKARMAITGGEESLSMRYFEGAAGGAVMLGSAPACEDYQAYFDWPDATIDIPRDAANLGEVLADLDAQPERLALARRHNVVNSLRRHDWVYRWRHVLETVGLSCTTEMHARMTRLNHLAELALQDSGMLAESVHPHA